MQSNIRPLLIFALCLCSVPAQADDDSSAQELFHQRIMPIFRSPNPSSCVQCHLSAVDLKNYILPSHQQTFVSLRDQGLIDLKSPSDSKILTLIDMGEKDADKGARLIHEKTRRAEYEAFAAWIEACCADAELVAMPASGETQQAHPEKPLDVIRHARKSRVVDSFVRNVWSQRMRCFPCHTPHELDPNNPQHAKPIEKQREMVKQYGQKINIFHETPEATVQHLITGSRKHSAKRLPLLNLEAPRKSLLVLKPTAKIPKKKDNGQFERPSSIEPVSHMGGLKMHVDDQSYKSFVAWIQDYANVVGDRYVSVEDLPADNWHPTMKILRMKDCSDNWKGGTPVQLFVHARRSDGEGWESEAIAFTQGTVTPRGIVNGSLFVLARDGSSPPSLTPGEYKISVFADTKRRIAEDPTLMLGNDQWQGDVIVRTRWLEKFKNATVISFNDKL